MRSIIIAGVFFVLATGAHAASINVYATASANTNSTPQDTETNFLLDADSAISSSYSARADASSGGVSGASNAFADGDTGVMRAASTMSGDRSDGLGNGGTNAQVRISEIYTISGSGTLTASILLDGTWDLSRVNIFDITPAPLPFWQVQSSVSIGTNRDFICLGTSCGPSLSQANSGSITDYLLTVSQDYSSPVGPTNVQVVFDLLTQISTGNGTIDFGNTAKLLVTTSGGLIATPSDPGFISDPAYFNGSVIPLPSSLLLLLAGVGAFGILRRRN